MIYVYVTIGVILLSMITSPPKTDYLTYDLD